MGKEERAEEVSGQEARKKQTARHATSMAYLVQVFSADERAHLTLGVAGRPHCPCLGVFLGMKGERKPVSWTSRTTGSQLMAPQGLPRPTHGKLPQKLVHDISLHVDPAAAQANLALVGEANASSDEYSRGPHGVCQQLPGL